MRYWAEGERTGERLIKFGRRSLCLRWAVGARKTPTLGAGELRGTSLARRGRRRRGAPAPSRALIGWRAGPYLLRELGRIFSPSSAPLAEAAWSRGMSGRPALFCSCFLRWLGRRKGGKEIVQRSENSGQLHCFPEAISRAAASPSSGSPCSDTVNSTCLREARRRHTWPFRCEACLKSLGNRDYLKNVVVAFSNLRKEGKCKKGEREGGGKKERWIKTEIELSSPHQLLPALHL